MNARGIRLDTSGKSALVSVDTETGSEQARALADLVGARYTDVIRLPENIDCWIDEEGLYTSQFNPILSLVITRAVPGSTPVFGAGVFFGVDPETGETISLTTEQTGRVLEQITTAGVTDLLINAQG